ITIISHGSRAAATRMPAVFSPIHSTPWVRTRSSSSRVRAISPPVAGPGSSWPVRASTRRPKAAEAAFSWACSSWYTPAPLRPPAGRRRPGGEHVVPLLGGLARHVPPEDQVGQTLDLVGLLLVGDGQRLAEQPAGLRPVGLEQFLRQVRPEAGAGQDRLLLP